MEEDFPLQVMEEKARQEKGNRQSERLGVPVKLILLIKLMITVESLTYLSI